jgi:hypothetical protein
MRMSIMRGNVIKLIFILINARELIEERKDGINFFKFNKTNE